MKRLLLLILIVSLFIISGCSQEDKVLDVYNDQIKALEEENLGDYLETLTSDQDKKEIEKYLKHVFESYDIEYTVHSIEVVDLQDNKAAIKTVVEVRPKNEGSDFKAVKTDSTHTLIKEGRHWKMESSTNHKKIFLN